MPDLPSPTRASRRYLRRFGVAMVAYVIVLPIALLVLPRAGDSPARYLVVLVPVVPFAVLGWAVWRYLVETDEFQRKLQLEALALAFAAGSVITFGLGMLQLAGLPRISWLWVWPVYAGCWLLARLLTTWRYR